MISTTPAPVKDESRENFPVVVREGGVLDNCEIRGRVLVAGPNCVIRNNTVFPEGK